MLFHSMCRCDYGQAHLSSEIEKALTEICLISPRVYGDAHRQFREYLAKQPYTALDLARICKAQALAGAPLPWEPDYERSVLEHIFGGIEQR